MTNILSFLFVFFVLQEFQAQEKRVKPFFSGNFHLTFAVNENFTLDSDDNETFFIPTATFFRFGFGYQLGEKFAISVNGGYDYHFPYAINAFPTYFTGRYNLWGNFEECLFLEVSRGKMWRPSSRYSDRGYCNIGIGWLLESGSRWKPEIKLMYHQKKIRGFENGRLESISLGFGFRFF